MTLDDETFEYVVKRLARALGSVRSGGIRNRKHEQCETALEEALARLTDEGLIVQVDKNSTKGFN